MKAHLYSRYKKKKTLLKINCDLEDCLEFAIDLFLIVRPTTDLLSKTFHQRPHIYKFKKTHNNVLLNTYYISYV